MPEKEGEWGAAGCKQQRHLHLSGKQDPRSYIVSACAQRTSLPARVRTLKPTRTPQGRRREP